MARFLLSIKGMCRATKLSIFCLIAASFSMPLLAATSIVVQPLHNGSFDEASDKTAAVLRQKLGEKKFLSVIDPAKVETVLNYYPDFNKQPVGADHPAEELLERAKEHYFQFAYEAAEAELTRAIGLLAEGQPLLDAWVTKALVDAARKKNGEVVEDFRNVLRLNPFYHLDSRAFAPSLHKLFREAEAENKQMPSGSLEISSDPKVAEIYLNGIYQGAAPLKWPALPEGNYRLRFQANNYRSSEQSLFVKGGETFKLHPRLAWVGPKKSGKAEKQSENSRRQILEGLRIAELLKSDKVLLVNVDADSVSARLVDRRFRSAHVPVFISLDGNIDALETHLDKLVDLVATQTQINLLNNPQAHLDTDGIGDPILLGRRRKKISKGFLFGGLGALVGGGVLAGVLMAGGGASPQTGSLALSFK